MSDLSGFPPVPHELHWLSNVIGAEATVALIEAHGGTRLYVPKKPEGSGLETTLGAKAAAALATQFGGESPRIPVAREWRVRVYHHRGLSYTAIAKKLGLHDGSVHRILKNASLTNAQFGFEF